MKWITLGIALILCGCGGTDTVVNSPPVAALTPLPPLTAEPVVTAPAYGTLGSGPVVVVLAAGIQDTLYDGYTDGMVPALVSAGFTVLTLDLPCHGADLPPGGLPYALTCWSQRIHDGDDDIFLRFCSGLSDVMDELHIKTAAIVGISRGGYVATICAAYEPRFTRIVQEIPVTDLNYLSEFQWSLAPEAIFNLQQYLPYIKGREILLSIDHADTRVGTDLAVTFGNQEGAQVVITPNGDHILLPADGTYAARWLQEHPF